jgi:hypothetical protein
VFTARYALSPYIKQICFVFKGFNCTGLQQVHNIKFEHMNPCILVRIITEVSNDRSASSAVSSRNIVQECLSLYMKAARSIEAPVAILTSWHVVVSPIA